MAINRDFPRLRAFSANFATDKIEEREIPQPMVKSTARFGAPRPSDGHFGSGLTPGPLPSPSKSAPTLQRAVEPPIQNHRRTRRQTNSFLVYPGVRLPYPFVRHPPPPLQRVNVSLERHLEISSSVSSPVQQPGSMAHNQHVRHQPSGHQLDMGSWWKHRGAMKVKQGKISTCGLK